MMEEMPITKPPTVLVDLQDYKKELQRREQIEITPAELAQRFLDGRLNEIEFGAHFSLGG